MAFHLYSSIFNGDILKYYDKTLQINMPIDKNSTYRLLGNRQNLLSLWNVNDRIRVNHDDNLPYGFKIKSEHKDNKVRWIHSKIPSIIQVHILQIRSFPIKIKISIR